MINFKNINFKNINLKNINIEDLKQKAKDLEKHKWCLIVAGVIMSLVGICSLFRTDKAVLSLAACIGIGFIISGICHIFAEYAHKKDSVDHPSWFRPQGVFEIIVGFILIANIGVTALSVPVMVVFWALFDGVMRINASYQLKKGGMEKWWLLLTTGLISVFFALLLLAHPFSGFISAPFLMGVTILAWGITAIYEALHLYD
jgi:uncharacterized membrane protein HdeD (DUF308 family)